MAGDVPVGGMRARLVQQSMFDMVRTSLTDLGWFATDSQHTTVQLRNAPAGLDEEVPPNTLALFLDTTSDEDAELGSNLTNDTTTGYWDFYAEDDSVGQHLINDIRDILRGKMTSIGRTGPVLAVQDWRIPDDADPPVLFYVDIEGVVKDRANNAPHPWQQFWFTCRFDLVDSYGDDS